MARALLARDIPFDCYESAESIGGMWRVRQDGARSAAFGSLRTNSSAKHMQFPCFRTSKYGGFWTRDEFGHYLESFARHYQILDRVKLRSSVTSIEPRTGGTWRVTVSHNDVVSQQPFDSVVVASGHHWCPKMPQLPGPFSGQLLHVVDYTDPTPFVDKTVIIVGLGNSAADVAVEVSSVARQTLLSARNGVHVIPRHIFGLPYDAFDTDLLDRAIPTRIARSLYVAALRVARGRLGDYGLPNPAHQLRQRTATVTSELLPRLRQGSIESRGEITGIDGNVVQFSAGAPVRADAIVCATGYSIAFPFLQSEVIGDPNSGVPLWRGILHPEIPNLYFAGLLDVLGAFPPVVEQQGEWIAAVMNHEIPLPPASMMWETITRERERDLRKYVGDRHYTLFHERFPYVRELKRDERLAGQNARANGRVIAGSRCR